LESKGSISTSPKPTAVDAYLMSKPDPNQTAIPNLALLPDAQAQVAGIAAALLTLAWRAEGSRWKRNSAPRRCGERED
jgi:hypothetical protein